MNTITRTTRVCTFETLNEILMAAIRAHSVKFRLGDNTSDDNDVL